jgi:hypothetical protein
MLEEGAFGPVEPRPERGPAESVAMCLPGGGYRAMLFHLGALWRLIEVGFSPGSPGYPASRGVRSRQPRWQWR